MKNKMHVYIDESNQFYVQEQKKEKIRKQKIFKNSKALSIKASKDLEKILIELKTEKLVPIKIIIFQIKIMKVIFIKEEK